MPSQVNEISPMLPPEQNTSPFKNELSENHIGMPTPSVNGIKNMVVRNKKTVSLVIDQDYKNRNFSNDDITMQPLKKLLLNSEEKLYRQNDSQIAEDYV